jgi:hypothetical protein
LPGLADLKQEVDAIARRRDVGGGAIDIAACLYGRLSACRPDTEAGEKEALAGLRCKAWTGSSAVASGLCARRPAAQQSRPRRGPKAYPEAFTALVTHLEARTNERQWTRSPRATS